MTMQEIISTYPIGQNVLYSYRHHLNSTSSFINTKKGSVTGHGYRKGKPVVKVMLVGNKTISYISPSDLQKCNLTSMNI